MAEWEISLEQLVLARGTALIRYAYLLCGDRTEAEDLVQEALLRTFAAGRRELDASTAEAYVRRSVLTCYLDGSRRRRRWAGIRHLLAPDDSAAGPETHHPQELDLREALARLTHRERACVVLRFYDDLTVPAIADRLGLRPGTVKRYLSDAVRRMEELLGVDVVAAAPIGRDEHLDVLTSKGKKG